MSREDQQILVVAQLILRMLHTRRFYLSEPIEDDGPYRIAMGMYIDHLRGRSTTLGRAIAYSDESLSTGRYLLNLMDDAGFIAHVVGQAEPTFRLMPSAVQSIRHFLEAEKALVQNASKRAF